MLDSPGGLLNKIALNFENPLMDKRSRQILHKAGKNMTQTCNLSKNLLLDTTGERGMLTLFSVINLEDKINSQFLANFDSCLM